MATPLVLSNKPAKHRRPEDEIQIAVIQHLQTRSVHGLVWNSVPNERKASAREGARLKRMGLRPGAADIIMSIPPNGLYAALELKAGNGRQTKTQKSFEHDVISSGGLYAVAHSIDEALSVLKGWGAIR
jgi:hypothetical protein